MCEARYAVGSAAAEPVSPPEELENVPLVVALLFLQKGFQYTSVVLGGYAGMVAATQCILQLLFAVASSALSLVGLCCCVAMVVLSSQLSTNGLSPRCLNASWPMIPPSAFPVFTKTHPLASL